MISYWRIKTGSDWRFSKILRIRTGSDSIFADQDWTRTEKFASPLISATHIKKANTKLYSLRFLTYYRMSVILLLRLKEQSLVIIFDVCCVNYKLFDKMSETHNKLLSNPILFLTNDIRIRSESCYGWNHTIRIRKLSKSVLRCTTYIFLLCLFYLMRQNNCWRYFAFC